jgi:hypothetical protein
MNDLEDRLRTALTARAADFTASPGAWERTTARARRPLRLFTSGRAGRRGLSRFTPLAAAAAVVAVAVTAATLASTGGWHDLVSSRPGTSTTAPVKPPWYWQPGAPNTALAQRGRDRGWLMAAPMCGRLIGPVISFDKATVWYSWGTGVYKDLYLCESSANGSQAGPAGRGPLATTQGWARDGLSGDAVPSVSSVTAVLADGHRVTGKVWHGGGLPYGLWEVDYPATDSAVIVFRDAAGKVVTQLNQPAPKPPVNPFTHPTPLTLTNNGDCANSGWTTAPVRVPQTMDGYQTWTYIQYGNNTTDGPALCEFAGLLNRSTSFSTSFRAFPALTVAQPVQAEEDLFDTSTISGISAPWVKSVTAVLADGKSYRGMFADGRSFPDPVWLVSFPAHATATLIFRDAAGRVVATLHGQNGNWPVGSAS